jgi:hypothetical protein
MARSTWLWIGLGAALLAAPDPSRADAGDANAAPPTPAAEDANAPRAAPAQDDANVPRPAALAPRARDLAAGAVEDLDLVEENVRFSVAAGEDKELDEAAFKASRQRHNPFARPFDRWENLLLFDRSGNGKISWQEAAQYRRELRRQVLAAHDVDRDGQLTGEERAAANKALAEGNLPALTPPKDKDRPGSDGDDPPASQPGSPAPGSPAPATQPAEE